MFGITALRLYICSIKQTEMKKIIVFTLVTFVTSTIIMAQSDSKFRLSVGPELSFPSGSFSNHHSVGIGGSAQAEVSLQEHLYGTATFGVMAYKGRSSGSNVDYKTATIIPLRVGVKYFLAGGIYGAAQLGVGFLSNTNPSDNISTPNLNDAGTAFAYSPQIGYEFKTKSGKALDASFKYEGYSKDGTIGAIGFRLAYIF